MHRFRAMLVLGLAIHFPLAFSASLSPAQQQPVAPITPVPPVLSEPAAGNPPAPAKNGRTGKKQSHKDDFLIIGTVFNPQALAFPAVQIRIRRLGENKYRWKTETNSRGDFAVRVSQGASYQVVVHGKGFADYTTDVDARHSGDTQQRLSIRMQPVAKEGTK